MHIRIAVTVTANPGGDAKEGWHRDLRARIALRQFTCGGVEQARQLFEKGVTEERQAVFNFIRHCEARRAQHARLPDGEDARFKQFVNGGALSGRQRALAALADEARDVQLGIENAFALYLGRVRGEHWHETGVGEKCGDFGGGDARGSEVIERVGQTAGSGCVAAQQCGTRTAAVVAVFGNIGEVRKIRESTHHGDRAVA